MKRWALGFAVLILAVTATALIYNRYFSTSAQIRAAATAFMRAAVSGDEAAIAPLLAPDSPLKAAEIAQMYKGDTYDAFPAYPMQAQANRSGVTWLATTSTLANDSGHATRGVTLAFKRAGGRWLIYKAGMGFSL